MMLPQMRVHQTWYLEMAMARAGSQTIEEGGGQGSRATLDYDLTVEQLAAEVGMSVRNIRNHHTRGLLPSPEVRARVGYYNAEHVARLRLILDLQADGFNLAAIERLLSGSDGLAERLLGLRKAVTTPFEPEQRELWQPFDEAGQPDEGWDELIEGVDSLRPLASEALLALFKLRMTAQLEQAFGKVIEHQAKRK